MVMGHGSWVNVKRHKKPIELVVREQVTAISWLEQVVFL